MGLADVARAIAEGSALKLGERGGSPLTASGAGAASMRSQSEKARLSKIARSGGCWSGQNLKVAMAVALAESGGDPSVDNGECCVGLWQMNRQHAGTHPRGSPRDEKEYTEWLKNPYNNAKAACSLWKTNRSFNPHWLGTYGKGKHLQHMGKDPEIVADKRGITDTLGDAAAAVTSPLDALVNLIEALFSPNTWFRLGKGTLGVTFVLLGAGLMLIIAVNTMTKGEAGKAVKTATKAVVTKKVTK